ALVTTAAGLLVAVPAVWSYHHLCRRVELLDSEVFDDALETGPDSERCSQQSRFAQKFPLKKQFSKPPSFASVGAPVLAIIVAAFTIFPPSQPPKGLHVRLLQPGALETKDRFPVEPFAIRVVDITAGSPTIYINSKIMPWGKLGNTVRDELQVRPGRTVTIEAGNRASWADVANVIDVVEGFHANVVLLTDEKFRMRRTGPTPTQ
ncbi:MAG: hypothetical protein WB510_08080, partial [Candidatus Sulfotelmatobacter sp.]